MNPLEGRSIDEILRWMMSRVEQGTPWSFIQNVIQYYRPDLNNQQFYDWAGGNLDREYGGNWTNEENWPDYERTLPDEIEWDERDFSHRDSYESEIQEELKSYKKDASKKGMFDNIFDKVADKFRSRPTKDGYYLVGGVEVDRYGYTRDGRFLANPWGRREAKIADMINAENAFLQSGSVENLDEANRSHDALVQNIERIRSAEVTDAEWDEVNQFMAELNRIVAEDDERRAREPRLSPTRPIDSNLPGSNKNQGGTGITVEKKEMYDFIPLQKTKVTKTITEPTFPTNNEMPDQNQQSMTYEDKEEALRKLKSTQFRAPNVFA